MARAVAAHRADDRRARRSAGTPAAPSATRAAPRRGGWRLPLRLRRLRRRSALLGRRSTASRTWCPLYARRQRHEVLRRAQGFNSGDQFFAYLQRQFDVLYAEGADRAEDDVGRAALPRSPARPGARPRSRASSTMWRSTTRFGSAAASTSRGTGARGTRRGDASERGLRPMDVMDVAITEWVSVCLRWLHMVAAMAWIGASFYFIHLDLALEPVASTSGREAEAWEVHGGGFYRAVKYLVAPQTLPRHFTWFKWEAYSTWLSGFALLVVIYYWNADLFLIDPARARADAQRCDRASAPARSSPPGSSTRRCAARRSARNENLLAAIGFVFLVVLCARLHARLQRPRRLHADGGAHRHDHGGERLRRHHSRPEEDRGRHGRRPRARAALGRRRQAAFGAQQLPDACRSSS